jgi:hypothetical protein
LKKPHKDFNFQRDFGLPNMFVSVTWSFKSHNPQSNKQNARTVTQKSHSMLIVLK